jgi:uncharacterized membrane protein
MKKTMGNKILHSWKENLDLLALAVVLLTFSISIVLQTTPYLYLSLSIITLFFATGYVLLAAVYPAKNRLSSTQRITGSFGLSIVASSAIFLVIGYTLHITLVSSLIALSVWSFFCILIAWLRRMQLPAEERYRVTVNFHFISWKENFTKPNLSSLLLASAILFLIFSAGRFIWVVTHVQPKYSEFYILGVGNIADNYIEQALAGAVITTTLGIVNHNNQETHYGIAYQLNNDERIKLLNVTLQPDKIWQKNVGVQMPTLGKINKVTFLLWNLDTGEVFDYLHLWVSTEHIQ